MNEMKTQTE